MQYLLHLKLRNTHKPISTNLETLLFKVLRLSQRGVFGSQENERNKREKRENCKPKTEAVKTAWIES